MGWDERTDLVRRIAHAAVGEVVSFQPKDGAAFDVRAIFFAAGTDSDLELEVVDVADYRPEAHFRIDVAAPDGILDLGRLPGRGDKVVARGVTYDATDDLEPDGEGEVRVKLFESDIP